MQISEMTVQTIYKSAQASVDFALACLEPAGKNIRLRSSFVDPEGKVMHWHDFGDLEGPGWAANAVGGATLLYRWGELFKKNHLQEIAIRIVDHILGDGFVQPDGFVFPYYDLAKKRFCLNYLHQDDWVCPGSVAKIGVQMLEFADELKRHGREAHLQECLINAAKNLSGWMANKVPLLPNSWIPRRITQRGESYPLNPAGDSDRIYDHSADGLYLLQLWTLTDQTLLATKLGESFINYGGFWGSINHDTFDDHENVAYATAFRILRKCGSILSKPQWIDFAYNEALPGMMRFCMEDDRHGVATSGLFYMENSWDTAYLWENAEVAQAFLEAWEETKNDRYKEIALAILEGTAKHHYGNLGFLSEGIDWNNHVSQRHHIHFDYYAAIRYTEPLLNNIHHLLPTLTLFSTQTPDSFASLLLPSSTKITEHTEKIENKFRYLIRFYHAAIEKDEGVQAAITFCKCAGMDGVLLFESSYDPDPAMLTLERLEQRFTRLKSIVPEFKKLGIEVHINIMITMGHVDAGGGRPEYLGFQMIVDEYGNQSRSTACPLDPKFLQYITKVYGWAAECDADVIWMDDDVRLLYHDMPGSACFCPLHLNAFSRISPPPDGAIWDLTTLVLTIKENDPQHKIRQQWLDFQESAIKELAFTAEQAVHTVDPEQRLGLMTVGTTIHHAEGRHTDRLLRVLAGVKHAPLLRPGSGFWHDQEPAAVLNKTEDVFRQGGFLGNDVRMVAEIENHPYTSYLKSRRILELEMALNVLAGCDDISLNIFSGLNSFGLRSDHSAWSQFLLELRPFLNQLAQARGDKIRVGIGIEASEEISRQMDIESGSINSLVGPRPWEILLQRLGLPVGKAQCSPHLISDDLVNTIDQAAIEMILEDGAVLTPKAVRNLIQKGWSERIGVLDVEPAPPGVNEWFTENPLNDSWMNWKLPVRHYQSTLTPHVYTLLPQFTHACLSRWVDIDGKDRGVASAAIELEKIGKIGILPYELPGITSLLLHESRRTQWGALFEWVCDHPLPCKVVKGVNLVPQVFSSRRENGILIAIINLSADDQAGILSGPVFDNHSYQRLTGDGQWMPEISPQEMIIPAWTVTILASDRHN